jgi:molecular chaperone DnaK
LPARLPAGTPFEITFFMSETGLLTVQAEDPRSGLEVRLDLRLGSLDQARSDQARRSVAGCQVCG